MEATLIFPHQLFTPAVTPSLDPARTVYLVEESLFITEFPTHVQKQLLHRLSLRAYQEELQALGYTVNYLGLDAYKTTESIFQKLAADKVTKVHSIDTTDDWLERRIELYSHRYHLDLVRYESPLFLLSKSDAIVRYQKSGRHMAHFYKKMRVDFRMLVELDDTPVGGRWSFDSENRKKVPKGTTLPDDITFIETPEVAEACAWQRALPGEHYGEAKVWVPYTRTGAQKFLEEFLRARFTAFGPYEDAIDTNHTRLFHSTLSPLLNIGLLTPGDVLTAAIAFTRTHEVPLASLEGFVRQILGWREFIRASYEAEGRTMRQQNFFKHTRKLPNAYWNATTGLLPVDTAIARAESYGYTHHIERLMVLGNAMLLSAIHPQEVYRWFMAMYVDAYDWVMVPNVYGMSQFADGGSFATKPYISGASYLKKMSNYPTGDWEATWTALYWNFIEQHKVVFMQNHRLAMMPHLFENMDDATKRAHRERARAYLNHLDQQT